MKNTPFGLPIGTVRATLALIITLTACACVIFCYPIPTWFEVGFGAVIALYFGNRWKTNTNQ